MKIKDNKVFYNSDSVKDMDCVEWVLMDDSEYEYNRVGIGEYKGKVFIVDLDDSGEKYRELGFVKEGMNIEDVLNIGIECGVWKEIDWGYDEFDKYRVCWDLNGDEFDMFKEKVGVEISW